MKDDDHTHSVTDAAGQDAPASEERLVGARELRVKEPPNALLRLRRGQLDAELAQKLGLEATGAPGPLVIGPFSMHEIRAVAEAGLIDPQEEILVSFDRWKTARTLFAGLPDFYEGGSEHTQTATGTATSTATATESLFGEDTQESGPGGTMMTPPPEGVPSTPSAVDSLPAGSIDKPLTPRIPAPALPRKAKEVPAPPRAETSAPAPKSTRSSPVVLTLGAAAILAVGAFVLGPGVSKAPQSEATDPLAPARRDPIGRQWPSSLQPRSVTTLTSNDSPLMAKLRPIMSDYEKGQLVLDPSRREILRALSDPASGSFEIRKLAANQLAVYMVAEGRMGEAKNLLRPILEAARTDAVTLLNLSLVSLAEEDFSQAREHAQAAAQSCPPGLCWMAELVQGMVEGYSAHFDGAEAHFRRAAQLSANNPVIPGVWLQSFVRNRASADTRIALLIRDALLFDPDRLLDSPIPAPLAGHVLVKEALSGLGRAADLVMARLSPGQKGFVRWFDGRVGRNPLNQPLGTVLDQLALESDPVSQILYAYALRDRGNLEQASQVLTRVLPLLDNQKGLLPSSWPWTYAGDVQFALGRYDSAVMSYQAAQARNSSDPGAFLGMALIFREKGSYPQAEAQLNEALRADPGFIPAVLRLSRFEWQSQALQR